MLYSDHTLICVVLFASIQAMNESATRDHITKNGITRLGLLASIERGRLGVQGGGIFGYIG